MLCEACQRLVQGRAIVLGHSNFQKPLQRVFAHHSKTSKIEDAADQGCVICNIVWARFSEPEKELARQTATQGSLKLFSNPLRRWKGINQLDLGWYGWLPHLHESRIVFIFGMYASKVVEIDLLAVDSKCILGEPGSYRTLGHLIDVESFAAKLAQLNEFKKSHNGNYAEDVIIPVECIFSQAYISQDMGSDQNVDLIASWLSVCSSEDPGHRHCHSELRPANSAVPSRLLDVAAGESGQDVRISLSHTDREPLPYVTLSHPWGSNPEYQSMPLLRKRNIEEQALEIPLGSFPQLFQDAIRITRRLGFRYIWIDAFCIIQGDHQDFLRESTVMGEIYQHAALNLAAGAATDSMSPLMSVRNVSLVRPFQTNVDWSSVPGESNISKSKPHFIFDHDFLSENLHKTLINQRSWILQEQTLAPRVLHFGKHQLFWKCHKSQFCETYPFGIPDLPVIKIETHLGPLHDRLSTPKDALKWLGIAERYSQCGITRLSDKLIAISGLASVFHARVLKGEQTYVAGTWSGSLIPSLLWHALDGRQWNETACSRPSGTDYMSPSWSWASVCSRLRFEVDTESLNALSESTKYAVVELRDFFVNLLYPDNPYGPVKEGFLILSGLLRPTSDFHWVPHLATGSEAGRNYNIRTAVFGFSSNFIDCVFDDIRDYDRRKTSNLIPGTYRLDGAFFLPVMIRTDSQYMPSARGRMPTVEGILMAPAEDDEGGYFRIGYFSARRVDDDEKMIAIFKEGKPSEFVLR